jgi:hypothetical protein
MSKNTVIEDEFYMFAKMAGLVQHSPKTFVFDGRKYTANAQADASVVKSFGGKARAYKLLRHARLIQYLAATPEGAHITGMVAKSFDAVSRKYPILRSYYDGTMIGGDHHAWLRC